MPIFLLFGFNKGAQKENEVKALNRLKVHGSGAQPFLDVGNLVRKQHGVAFWAVAHRRRGSIEEIRDGGWGGDIIG